MTNWQTDPMVQIERRLLPFVEGALLHLLADAPRAGTAALEDKFADIDRLLRRDGRTMLDDRDIDLAPEAQRRLDAIAGQIANMRQSIIAPGPALSKVATNVETSLIPLVNEALDIFREGFLAPVLERQERHQTQALRAAKEIQMISRQIYFISVSASVEASRAGDAGRGFAIISKQIRELAAATQEALDSLRGNDRKDTAA
ncbi:MAG: methyl-accepting chemotaxis protein [Pseudomonadota bacterium]